MKWRLMLDSEMDYGVHTSTSAYITHYPEDHPDPLFSIEVHDGSNKQLNIDIAKFLVERMNENLNGFPSRKDS